MAFSNHTHSNVEASWHTDLERQGKPEAQKQLDSSILAKYSELFGEHKEMPPL